MEQSEYAGIVENYLDTVYRAALSFCGNVQDAEDVVQNTFLKLFLKAPAFQSEEHMRTAAGTLRADFRKMIQEDEKNH